jgi:hypothetical protein
MTPNIWICANIRGSSQHIQAPDLFYFQTLKSKNTVKILNRAYLPLLVSVQQIKNLKSGENNVVNSPAAP